MTLASMPELGIGCGWAAHRAGAKRQDAHGGGLRAHRSGGEHANTRKCARPAKDKNRINIWIIASRANGKLP